MVVTATASAEPCRAPDLLEQRDPLLQLALEKSLEPRLTAALSRGQGGAGIRWGCPGLRQSQAGRSAQGRRCRRITVADIAADALLDVNLVIEINEVR